MMLGFIGMEPLYVGLQRGQVTKFFWTVRTPEWLGICRKKSFIFLRIIQKKLKTLKN